MLDFRQEVADLPFGPLVLTLAVYGMARPTECSKTTTMQFLAFIEAQTANRRSRLPRPKESTLHTPSRMRKVYMLNNKEISNMSFILGFRDNCREGTVLSRPNRRLSD